MDTLLILIFLIIITYILNKKAYIKERNEFKAYCSKNNLHFDKNKYDKCDYSDD